MTTKHKSNHGINAAAWFNGSFSACGRRAVAIVEAAPPPAPVAAASLDAPERAQLNDLRALFGLAVSKATPFASEVKETPCQ